MFDMPTSQLNLYQHGGRPCILRTSIPRSQQQHSLHDADAHGNIAVVRTGNTDVFGLQFADILVNRDMNYGVRSTYSLMEFF
jgi:hypothetical protein